MLSFIFLKYFLNKLNIILFLLCNLDKNINYENRRNKKISRGI